MIYCVESETNLLYEVQFFDTFAMVKPASPGFEQALRKLSLSEYEKEFREYYGDPDKIFVPEGGPIELTE